MKLKKIIRPLVLPSILMLSLSVKATNIDEVASSADYFYMNVKAGVVISTSIKGNSDLQSVAPDASYTTGLAFGKKLWIVLVQS